MVAIHVPHARDHERPGAPRAGARPLVAVPDRLPDRATRVRRRRLALLIVMVALAVAVMAVGRATAALVDIGGGARPEPITADPAAPVAGGVYVVQPGDTMWSIATQVAPDDDPRAVVDALRDANGGSDLQVGEHLVIDVG
ncbi:MAG TPA: LysM domain-containing protein [Acidimicrobiales bacterium]|nr:LysM domain-containing protein [Acidimicrobiales bacterium]